MTARDIYEGVLVDLNKVHAPALSIEEFNYFINKVILAYVNERYNMYSVNQQLDDDLRILLVQTTISGNDLTINSSEDPAYVQVQIEATNYMHLLSCDMIVQNTVSNKLRRYTAKRVSVDMLSAITLNEYLKPAMNRPYYILSSSADVEERNSPIVVVYFGEPLTNIVPYSVRFFYLRLPGTVTLTDAQVYSLTRDESDVIEFPDYLKNEFVKRIVLAQLDESGDQRISNFAQLNQEIPIMPLELTGGDVRNQAYTSNNTNSTNN